MDFFNIAQQETSEQILTTVNGLETAIGSNDGTIVIDGKRYVPYYDTDYRFVEEVTYPITTSGNTLYVDGSIYYVQGTSLIRADKVNPMNSRILGATNNAPVYTNGYITWIQGTNICIYNPKTDETITVTTTQFPHVNTRSQTTIIGDVAIGINSSKLVNFYNFKTDTNLASINWATIWTSLGLTGSGNASIPTNGAWIVDGEYAFLLANYSGTNDACVMKFHVTSTSAEYVSGVKVSWNHSTYVFRQSMILDGHLVYLSTNSTENFALTYVSVRASDMVATVNTINTVNGWATFGASHKVGTTSFGAEGLFLSNIQNATGTTPTGTGSTNGSSRLIVDSFNVDGSGILSLKQKSIVPVPLSSLTMPSNTSLALHNQYFNDGQLYIYTGGYNYYYNKSPRLLGYKEVKE